LTVETGRRGRCGLAETLVESGYEAAQHLKNTLKAKKWFFHFKCWAFIPL